MDKAREKKAQEYTWNSGKPNGDGTWNQTAGNATAFPCERVSGCSRSRPEVCFDVRDIKTRVPTLAIRLGIKTEDLAELAAETSFPQPVTYEEPTPSDEEPEAARAENSAFVIGELVASLEAAKENIAPGADSITLTMLLIVQEDGKADLLGEFNTYWSVGELPVEWKLSIVIPITKPGKPLTNARNLRPISLTSNFVQNYGKDGRQQDNVAPRDARQATSHANRI